MLPCTRVDAGIMQVDTAPVPDSCIPGRRFAAYALYVGRRSRHGPGRCPASWTATGRTGGWSCSAT